MSPRPQPKRWRASEILQAIAREMARPRPGGIGLACPEEITNLTRTGKRPVAVRIPYPVHHLRRWMDVLDTVDTVTVGAGTIGADPHITVTGRLPRGPQIELTCWAYDLTLDDLGITDALRQREERPITADDLRAADDATRTRRSSR